MRELLCSRCFHVRSSYDRLDLLAKTSRKVARGRRRCATQDLDRFQKVLLSVFAALLIVSFSSRAHKTHTYARPRAKASIACRGDQVPGGLTTYKKKNSFFPLKQASHHSLTRPLKEHPGESQTLPFMPVHVRAFIIPRLRPT